MLDSLPWHPSIFFSIWMLPGMKSSLSVSLMAIQIRGHSSLPSWLCSCGSSCFPIFGDRRRKEFCIDSYIQFPTDTADCIPWESVRKAGSGRGCAVISTGPIVLCSVSRGECRGLQGKPCAFILLQQDKQLELVRLGLTVKCRHSSSIVLFETIYLTNIYFKGRSR